MMTIDTDDEDAALAPARLRLWLWRWSAPMLGASSRMARGKTQVKLLLLLTSLVLMQNMCNMLALDMLCMRAV